MLVNKKILRL